MTTIAGRVRTAAAITVIALLAAAAVLVPPPAAAAEPEPRVVKARILDVRARRGEMRVDVAGRPETHRARDAALLRRFRAGDLVVLSLDASGTIVDVRSAALRGRVTRIERGRGEVLVHVDGGGEEAYRVEGELLGRIRAGETIRFEVEERSTGESVITAIR